MAVKEKPATKTIATNREARHEYFVIEALETGIELKGTEVKSVDLSNINSFPFDSFTEQSIHAVTQTDNIHFAA